ncbi:MAG: isoprenylcysteine carboxylmethyltransferase family protein [Gemmatimonadaceae bacterium]
MRGLELRVPPLVVALVAALLMWAAARAAPDLSVDVPARAGLALALAVVGAFVAVAGVLEFRRARTTVNPLNPDATSALVVTGVYRISRNPMYLGLAIVLLAGAAYLSHALAPLGVAAFAAYIHRFQILPEERALRALFPGDFKEYAGQVRRWL